jgi:hypothetical protein
MKSGAILVGLIFVVLSIFLIKNNFQQLQILDNGALVKMRILEIPDVCSGTKAKYFIKVLYNDKTYSTQIGSGFCGQHKVGDIVEMRYLDGEEQILFPEDDVTGNLISSVILLLFGFFIVVYAFKTL